MTAGVASRAADALLRHAPHALLASVCGGLLMSLAVRVPAPVALIGAVGLGIATLDRVRRGACAGYWLLAGMLAVAGWGWGSARVEATTPVRVPFGHVVGVVQVDGHAQASVHGRRVNVRAERLTAGVPIGTRLVAELPDRGPDVRLGMRLRVVGRLAPAATARSPDWWRAYLVRQGIAARLTVESVRVIGTRGGLTGVRDRARNAAIEAVGRGLSGEPRAVVRGMTLGGGSGLSEETAQQLRDAGVWHLLAVSGQNVGMVGIALTVLLQALGFGKRPATAVALIALVSYCLICDGGASVVRAGIVGALGLFADLRRRDRQPWYLMLVGFTILLIHQPRAIMDPGLQLSFAAVVGMFTIAPPIQAWCMSWVPTRLAEIVAHGAAATLTTSPIVIWHFGRLSLAGLLVNLVAVPLAAGIVVTGLSGMLLGSLIAPLGTALAHVNGSGASFLLWLARVASAVPGASVSIPAGGAFIGVLLVVAVIVAIRRVAAVDGPAVGLRLPQAGLRAALAAVIVAVAILLPSRRPPEPWPTQAAVTVLDIGQGDAILLRSPEGAAALIDTGPPGRRPPVERALRRAGVERLDLLAITHDQLDHSGAAQSVLEDVPVGTFVTPVLVPPIVARARTRGVPVRTIAAGDVIQVGVWRLDVLWPLAGFTPPADANDAALVLRARAPGISALLTADAESNVLTRLRLEHVDVLKVSHHGSDDPGLGEVLRRLTPTTALISVGAGNSYGHPVPATLATLAHAGVRVERTDRAGNVTAIAGPDGITLSAERGG